MTEKTKQPDIDPKDLRRVLGLPSSASPASVRGVVAAYQRAASLPITGEPDEGTWAALRR